MRFSKKKFVLSMLIVLAFRSNIYAIQGNNVKNNSVKWKKVELKPDLNKDGKQDKLVVEYYEEGTKVYTRFIPKVKGEKTGKIEEKVFEKSTFQTEFNKYTQQYVENYSKINSSNSVIPQKTTENPSKLNSKNTSTDTNKNSDISDNSVDSIRDLQNQVITNEAVEQQETDSGVEKTTTISKEQQKALTGIKGPYTYIEYYLKERPKNLTFNYKYSKNTPQDLDEFVFIKTASNIRKEPNAKATIIKKSNYASKLKVVGKVKTNTPDGTAEWYEVQIDGNLGYVIASNAIKREFDWEDMTKKIDKMNKFVREALNSSKTIYVLDDYTPLGGGSGTVKDKFGNRENQSEKGYTNANFSGQNINIPDRSLMTIVEETSKYIKVKIDAFDGEYYLKPSSKKLLKDSKIKSDITRFIYVDRKSQNEMIVEKNENSDTYNVITASFVTTGKDSGNSYATPYGAFLIAYGKPTMQYTGNDNQTIVGDAKNAVRFSGGGYMHSIPSLFEPKATRPQRRAATAKKIGTFAESHKCIRHYDDQIKFIYDWLGNSTPNHKYGYRTPTVPTVMLVK